MTQVLGHGHFSAEDQFASKVEAVRAIACQQAAALATAQATFDALLHQSFRR